MGSVLVLDRWATSRQSNSQWSLLPQRAIQRWHNKRENNEINRLDKLGNTSRHRHHHVTDIVGCPRIVTTNDGVGGATSQAEVKIVIGGPHKCRGRGGNMGSINTDVCFDTCVSRGSMSAAGQYRYLDGSLGGLILAVTYSSL